MYVHVEYSQADEYELEKSFIESVVEQTMKKSGLLHVNEKEIRVSIAFVSESEIQRINKEFRGKDAVTDVLSFHEYDQRQDIEQDTQPSIFLGELILCYDYIMRAAIEDKVPLLQEMSYIVSHGILHLCGYDHSEEMFAIQDAISEQYTITN